MMSTNHCCSCFLCSGAQLAANTIRERLVNASESSERLAAAYRPEQRQQDSAALQLYLLLDADS